jgi:hypothetical protein
VRRSGRLAPRHDRLGPAGEGVGAPAARPVGGLPRGHPGAGALCAGPSGVAGASCRQPRRDGEMVIDDLVASVPVP